MPTIPGIQASGTAVGPSCVGVIVRVVGLEVSLSKLIRTRCQVGAHGVVPHRNVVLNAQAALTSSVEKERHVWMGDGVLGSRLRGFECSIFPRMRARARSPRLAIYIMTIAAFTPFTP